METDDIVTFAVNVGPYVKKGNLKLKKNAKTAAITCDIGGINFIGKEDGASKQEKFIIVERNTETGELTLTEKCPIHFRPSGPQNLDESLNSSREEKDGIDNSFLAKRTKLTEAFGSARSLRKLNDAQQLSVGTQGKDFMAACADAEKTIFENQTNNSEESISDLLPPYDMSATTPSAAYDMTAIVKVPLAISLNEEVETLANAKKDTIQSWRQEGTYPTSVLNRLSSLPTQSDRRQQVAASLVVLKYLLKMFKMPAREISKKDPLPDLPKVASTLLLQAYTEEAMTSKGKQRMMPARLKDKLIYHSLLVCLSIDNYTTELADLQVEFKLAANKLTKYFLALGCKVTKAVRRKATVQVATLTVPLTFPEVTMERKRKGK